MFQLEYVTYSTYESSLHYNYESQRLLVEICIVQRGQILSLAFLNQKTQNYFQSCLWSLRMEYKFPF